MLRLRYSTRMGHLRLTPQSSEKRARIAICAAIVGDLPGHERNGAGRKIKRLVARMRAHNDRAAIVTKSRKRTAHPGKALAVEAGGWLVQKQKPWFM